MKYIEIDESAQIVGKKNVLNAETELLSIARHSLSYKRLRKVEENFKNLLQRKLQELEQDIRLFESSLPRLQEHEFALSPHKEIMTKRDIEQEIEAVKQRIAALR